MMEFNQTPFLLRQLIKWAIFEQFYTFFILKFHLNEWNDLLTCKVNWVDKLFTWSRASPNSRFNRRTSFACLSSAEPYNDEPPDINDAVLPWAVNWNRYRWVWVSFFFFYPCHSFVCIFQYKILIKWWTLNSIIRKQTVIELTVIIFLWIC